MDIYSILASKPHNSHYLNRYINFIEQCQQKNVGYEGIVEKHHICPKADDMFPEYVNFRKYLWNKALLTPRQHFIAHIILWKTFYSTKSCGEALWFMSNGNWKKYTKFSIIYESLRKKMKNTWVSNGKRLGIASIGKAVVKDSNGLIYRIDVSDERYTSGIFVGHTKGMRVVKDEKGKMFMSNSNEYTSIHKDMVPVKDENGKIFKIHRNSNDWQERKYQAQHAGTITVKDKSGNTFRVDKDDPRYISGKLVGIAEGTITVKDKSGNTFRVDKDDPRYISGELVGSMKGRITITNGKENKRIFPYDEIPDGWRRGMTRKSSDAFCR
jgi:hypothetical protein